MNETHCVFLSSSLILYVHIGTAAHWYGLNTPKREWEIVKVYIRRAGSCGRYDNAQRIICTRFCKPFVLKKALLLFAGFGSSFLPLL